MKCIFDSEIIGFDEIHSWQRQVDSDVMIDCEY